MHAENYLLCPKCAELRLVDAPPCTDGHGDSCPDRACTLCGTALFVDPPAVHARVRRTARRAA